MTARGRLLARIMLEDPQWAHGYNQTAGLLLRGVDREFLETSGTPPAEGPAYASGAKTALETWRKVIEPSRAALRAAEAEKEAQTPL